MRKILATALAVLTAAGLAAACGGGDGADGDRGELTKVTVVLDWTPNTNHAGLYLAQREGLYEKAGLDVTIIEPDANGGLPMLAAGQADVAVSVAEALLPARAQGADVVSVGAIIAHNTSSLLMPADRNVRSAKDLEAKRYGGWGGELELALLSELMKCAGGDPSKLDLVEIGNVDFSIGFSQKQYDAVWVFDGWDLIRLRDLEGMAVTTIPFYEAGADNCLPDWYTPLLAVSGSTIAEKPAIVRAFMGATAAGYEKARTDPAAAAAALLDAAPELDEDLVTRSAQYLASRYADAGAAWGLQQDAVWEDFAAFLVEHDLLPADFDVSGAFTDDFLPR